MTVILVRLAFAGIRSRLLASALTIAIAAAAVGTIVLALEVRSSGIDPWQRTFAEANGAHVLAFVPSQADTVAIGELPGVTERSGPTPHVLAATGPRGNELVQLAGLSRPPVVNTPLPTGGSARPDGGIVLERSFARALGLEVGDTVEVTRWGGDRSIEVPVLGTAVVPSQARYPRSKPGLAWVPPATLERVEPDRSAWRWSEAVRLAEPSASSAFTTRAAATLPPGSDPGSVSFQTWQAQRDLALGDAQGTQVIVTMFTVLLLIVAFVVVGVLVGARSSEQHRQVGLLKAVGFTPRQVGIVFALESVALGVVAAVLGFALGAILAPRLAEPSAQTLVGSPTMAANPWHILVACSVVLPVLFAGAVTSTRRSTRFTAVEAIRAGTVSPPNRDPALPLRTPKKREALPDTLTMGEVERLLAQPGRDDLWERHFPGKPERDRLLLALMAYAGLRRSELLGLEWDDVDLSRRLLRVRKAKGGRQRTIPIHPALAPLFAEYYATRVPLTEQAVFVGVQGSRLHYTQLGQVFRHYVDAAGVNERKRVTPHTLRHVFASELLRAGANLRQIQELLGHKHLDSTQRYTRVNAHELRGAIKRLRWVG